MAKSDYVIPPNIKDAFDRWVEHGQLPGGFCTSVLENDFTGAVLRADMTNFVYLRNIALYVTWELPSECWGSAEKVQKWQEKFPRE